MSSSGKSTLGGGVISRRSQPLDDSFLFENMSIGMYVCDEYGKIIRYNRAMAELWNREPEPGNPAERFCGAHRIFDADGWVIPQAESPMGVALLAGQGCRDQHIQIERPDGGLTMVSEGIEILRDRDRRIVGAVGMVRLCAAAESTVGTESDKINWLQKILHALPAAIYTTDKDGRITFYNNAALNLWGMRPDIGQSKFCGSWKLYWPDGTRLAHDECPMAVALKEQRAINGQEAAAERPDGTRVPFLAYPTPLFNDARELIGAVNLLVDIRERKLAEVAGQRLAAIVSSSDDAILSKDVNGTITSWNRGAEYLFGYVEAEVIGQPVTILIPNDRQDEEPKILARIRRGEHIEHYETVRQKKDGTLVDISLSVSPIVDAQGKVVGASKIARDISDSRRAEEQKDLMLREMNHRVKNLFALAGGLLNLTAYEAVSVPDLVSDLQKKFQALARAHSLTLAATAESGFDEVASLHALILEVTKPYLGGGEDTRIVVTGCDAPLGRAAITNIALLFHELSTNALKYGALADPNGQLRVESFHQGDDVCIIWRELGTNTNSEVARGEGFGSRLTRAAVSALGGDLSREFAGAGAEIRITLSRVRLSA